MERHFDQDLEALKEQLLRMGSRTEAVIQKAIEALKRRDDHLAREVFEDDRAIDRMEIEVDERCVGLLALRQPMASDLRFITAALKIAASVRRRPLSPLRNRPQTYASGQHRAIARTALR